MVPQKACTVAKRKVNKSEKIRQALAAHPDAGPTEIAKMLAAQKVKVSVQQVSTVKNKAKSGGSKSAKRGRPKAKAPQALHGALDSAFEFVEKVGGLVHAESLIDKLKAFKAKL